MKQLHFLSIFMLCAAVNVAAQYSDYSSAPAYRYGKCNDDDRCPRNALFHETQYDFSHLGINSINWDHTLNCERSYLTSFRIGINYLTFPKISAAGIPAEICLMLGRGALMLELAAGFNSLYVYKNYTQEEGKFSDKTIWVALNGRAGLRYEAPGSLFVRAGIVPAFGIVGKNDIQQLNNRDVLWMASLGLGYNFRNR